MIHLDSITQSIFSKKKIKYKQNREWVAGGKLTYFTEGKFFILKGKSIKESIKKEKRKGR